VSALNVGGSYDVTHVWLVLWQLCICRRPGHRDPAFIRTQASKPRRLL